tara:strand:+ start:12124 stop:12390 length:267 start_codon:yes stop_codon:yes gene_type:complete
MSEEKKEVYIGYVGEMRKYDSGVVKFPLSFKLDQLDELKKYATQGGNVNIDLVVKTDGAGFLSVFNPRAVNTYKKAEDTKPTETALPF